MIYINHKIKQFISVLLILSFILPFANFAKAEGVPQAPPEVYPGGAPPANKGGGIWGWLGSAAACIGGSATGVGATVGCSGLAGKLTKFIGGEAGGWLQKGLGIGLDVVAKRVRKNIIEKTYQKMIDWIADEGQQVTDIQKEIFGWGTVDEAAGQILAQALNQKGLCNPYDYFGTRKDETIAKLKIILGEEPRKQEQEAFTCKLSAMASAGEQFFTNFEGGWDAWLEVSTQPMANPYGFYLYTLEKQNTLLDQLQTEKQINIASGKGFLGQEKIFRWHIITDATTEEQESALIKLDKCPSEEEIGAKCSLDSDSPFYCQCPVDGVSPKTLKEYYGIQENTNIITKNKSEICDDFEQNCYLVIDHKEIITPGAILADAGADLLQRHVKAVESGDIGILEYYTGKVLDDIFGALIKRGFKAIAKDEEDISPEDGFHITSRREQIGAIEDESVFEALKSTYEETLLAFKDIFDKKDELRYLLETSTPDKDLYEKSNEFYYCAMNKCVEQEYDYCEKLEREDSTPCKIDLKGVYAEHQPASSCYDFDKTCVTKCDTACKDQIIDIGEGETRKLSELCDEETICKADPSREDCTSKYCTQLENCKTDCETKPSCALATSDLGKCQTEGWNYCTTPKLPGPEYDNPQIQRAYESRAEIISYKYPGEFTNLADRVDYGGFVDDCTAEDFTFNDECWKYLEKNPQEEASYNTCVKELYTKCFNAKLNGGSYDGKKGERTFTGLLNIEQFITWDKEFIKCADDLDDKLGQYAMSECPYLTPGRTRNGCGKEPCTKASDYYWYLKGTPGGEKTVEASYWKAKLERDQQEREKYYKNGLDAYDYLIFKKKQLRRFYSQEYNIPDNVDINCESEKDCTIEELANALSRKKQSRALKMDTWNKNTYKTQWEDFAQQLADQENLLAPKTAEMAKLIEEAQILQLKEDKTLEEEKRLEETLPILMENLGKEMTPIQNEITRLEDELKKIETASGDLKQDIEDLNQEIIILQDVYDNATEQLVGLIADIDSVLKTSTIDNELEKAKKYLGKESAEWTETQKNIIDGHMKGLGCDSDYKNYLSWSPPPAAPPPAAPPPAAPPPAAPPPAAPPIEEPEKKPDTIKPEEITLADIDEKLNQLLILSEQEIILIPDSRGDLCADYEECKTECLDAPAVDDKVDCAIQYWEYRLEGLE